MPRKIILPGGSGFLGRTLAAFFSGLGCEVVVFSRSPGKAPFARTAVWDAKTLGDWTRELESAHAVINLTGRSVNCRYTPANRQDMMNSRVDSTVVLGQAIAACARPPEVWLNSSTATIYQHRYDAPNDEFTGKIGPHPEAKDAFSVEIAKAWERAFEEADCPVTRKIILRTAMVMGHEPGGVYETLRRLVKLGLGGSMGHGRQYVSWLHDADFCAIVEWLISRESATGIYNLAAPDPLPNREMMAILRRETGIPIGLPATRWMLEMGAFALRTETELILKSRRVVPARLIQEGYEFRYPDFTGAVKELEQGA